MCRSSGREATSRHHEPLSLVSIAPLVGYLLIRDLSWRGGDSLIYEAHPQANVTSSSASNTHFKLLKCLCSPFFRATMSLPPSQRRAGRFPRLARLFGRKSAKIARIRAGAGGTFHLNCHIHPTGTLLLMFLLHYKNPLKKVFLPLNRHINY